MGCKNANTTLAQREGKAVQANASTAYAEDYGYQHGSQKLPGGYPQKRKQLTAGTGKQRQCDPLNRSGASVQ